MSLLCGQGFSCRMLRMRFLLGLGWKNDDLKVIK